MSAKLKLLTSAKVNGTIPVYKYESERTGLKVVLAQVEGPLVNGYFTLGNQQKSVHPLKTVPNPFFMSMLLFRSHGGAR